MLELCNGLLSSILAGLAVPLCVSFLIAGRILAVYLFKIVLLLVNNLIADAAPVAVAILTSTHIRVVVLMVTSRTIAMIPMAAPGANSQILAPLCAVSNLVQLYFPGVILRINGAAHGAFGSVSSIGIIDRVLPLVLTGSGIRYNSDLLDD